MERQVCRDLRKAENLALLLSFAIPLAIYLLLPARRFLPDGVVNVTFGSQEKIKLGLAGFLLLPSANHYLFDLLAMMWAKMLNGFSSTELLRSFQVWSALFGVCGTALTIFWLARL